MEGKPLWLYLLQRWTCHGPGTFLEGLAVLLGTFALVLWVHHLS